MVMGRQAKVPGLNMISYWNSSCQDFGLEQFGGDIMSLSPSSEFEQESCTVLWACVSKITIKTISCRFPSFLYLLAGFTAFALHCMCPGGISVSLFFKQSLMTLI